MDETNEMFGIDGLLEIEFFRLDELDDDTDDELDRQSID